MAKPEVLAHLPMATLKVKLALAERIIWEAKRDGDQRYKCVLKQRANLRAAIDMQQRASSTETKSADDWAQDAGQKADAGDTANDNPPDVVVEMKPALMRAQRPEMGK